MHKLSKMIVVRRWSIRLLACGLGMFVSIPKTVAQIRPDATLGSEASTVTRGVRIRNTDSVRIEGGARRGANLFHSFEQFNVPEESAAYFTNPSGVQNIFSRVTGGNRSEILGQLGVIQAGSDSVLGNANLFLLNPNGILFGRNARLDVGGSFVGTTASAIQFGVQNSFSAINPEIPSSLLTVNPTAFLFNQIASQSIPSIESRGFLSVPAGQSLLLIGHQANFAATAGGVTIRNSTLEAPGGRIEIAGFAGPGSIGLNFGKPGLALENFSHPARSNVTIDSASLDVSGATGGTIQINAENLRIATSTLLSGSNQAGSLTEPTGLIQLAANGRTEIIRSNIGNLLLPDFFERGSTIDIRTGALAISGGSILETTSLGAGRAGDINLIVQEDAVIDGENTRLRAAATGTTDGGNIQIQTRSLQIRNAARLITSTFGQGNAGDILVNVAENMMLEGAGSNRQGGGLFSSIERNASGKGGNISVRAGSLGVQGGAGILARNNDGAGQAGQITLEIDNAAVFRGTSNDADPIPSGVSTDVTDGAVGNGGNIRIRTGSLLVTDGAQLIATTSGRGNAGRFVIQARDSVAFDGLNQNGAGSGAFTGVDATGIGRAGDLKISARSLSVSNGAQLSSNSLGRGDAGDIIISTHDGISLVNGGTIFSNLEVGAEGNGGNIVITADALAMSGGSQLRTDTLGRGSAGDVTIRARESVTLDGTGSPFSSSIFTITASVADGPGGNVEITTPLLQLSGNALVNTSTANAERSGDITINAGAVALLNGGQLVTTTSGDGLAGNINLNADTVFLAGRNPLLQTQRRRSSGQITLAQENGRSGLFASTQQNARGNGGTIAIDADQVELENGARISARSQGSGVAGNIDINVNEATKITNSDITTAAQNSSGGTIDITSEQIRLRGDSDIRTNVANDAGNGGDITLRAASIVAFDDSDVLAFAGAQGGDITFDTPAVFFEGGRQAVTASTSNATDLDNNGQVNVNADGAVAGVITFPDVSFIENSLSDLPTNAIDTSQLLANSCIARTETGGTFLITGAGGLPAAPGSNAAASYPTGAIRAVPAGGESEEQGWQPGDAIVEPQGVYQLPDGRLVLSRECADTREVGMSD